MSISSLIKSRRVLGIDASTNSIAFCLIENGIPVEWGEIQYRHDGNLFERLGSIEQRAKIVVDRYSDVDFVLIEAPVKVQNVRIAISLAYSYGIVAAKFASIGIEVSDVPPVTWQKYIGNNPFTAEQKRNFKEDNPGRSQSWISNEIRKQRKEKTIQWVLHNFGISARTDNVSDAIGVAIYGYEQR